MRDYSIDELKAKFKELKYNWYSFHIIGIRSKQDAVNVFDDVLYLVDDDKLFKYQITTNPGTHWLVNVMNPKGAAVLKPDQYVNTWELGKHRGLYTALVQVKPVSVYRDNNKDNKSDETGAIDYGLFGINIHRSSENSISTFIDKWSAGCQVFANGSQYKDFIKKCEASKLRYFTYSLLKEF